MFRSLQAAVTITAAAVTLAACGLPSATASAERETDARALVANLAAGRDDVIAGNMSSDINPAELRAQLPFLKSLIPAGPVPEGTTVGWRANTGTGGSTYVVNRIYDYPDRTLAVETVFVKRGEAWKVAGFHVLPTMKAGATPPAAAPETSADAPAVKAG